MFWPVYCCCFFLAFLFVYGKAAAAQQEAVSFDDVINKMEQYALDLARELEDLHASNQCNVDDLLQCQQRSHDHCMTELPNQECPGGGIDHPFKTEYHFPQCGELGGPCSTVFDFTTTSVHYPASEVDKNLNFTDNRNIEDVCWTADIDEWFVEKKDEDLDFWRGFGAGPRWRAFGSQTGLFRFYPARSSALCLRYDPRATAWYSGATSGPKNVVLLLDVSESMQTEDRLQSLKTAAQRIVRTLTYRDHVTIIPFAMAASAVVNTDGYMYQATVESAAALVGQIGELEALSGQQANYSAAFQEAFDILERSAASRALTDCHTAILFFTAGEAIDMPSNDLLDNVVEKTEAFGQTTNNQVAHFTFSVTSADFDDGVHDFLKALACHSEIGLWTQIAKPEDAIDSLWGYYNVFALGVAYDKEYFYWAESIPDPGSGGAVASTSAPVFAQGFDPPLLLGATYASITFDSIDNSLGIYTGYGGSEATIQQYISLRAQKCPRLEVPQCTMESFRRRETGGRATCGNITVCEESDLVQVETTSCQGMEDHYPTDLWSNRNNQGKSYQERACCVVDDPEPSAGQCSVGEDSDDDEKGLLIGCVVGGIVFVVAIAAAIYYASMKPRGEQGQGEKERKERGGEQTNR